MSEDKIIDDKELEKVSAGASSNKKGSSKSKGSSKGKTEKKTNF